MRREQYGYTLRKTLSDRALEIDEGTLYLLLRRLESQGLLASQWREEDKRKKRFYLLSTDALVHLPSANPVALRLCRKHRATLVIAKLDRLARNGDYTAMRLMLFLRLNEKFTLVKG